MGRKKIVECESCGTKHYLENSVEIELKSGEKIYFCSSDCYNAMSDDELIEKEIYSLFKSILSVRSLNKTVKGYIRNRLNDDFDDKREILFSVLCKKREKIVEIMCKKTFSSTTIKAKYVFACVKKDVDDIYKANKEAEQKIDNFEVPFSLNKTVIRKIKDITNWLTL